MSMGPTWVQADDGRWYKNPIILGPGFYVCWDEDEPIELVVECDDPRGLGRVLVVNTLMQLGLWGWKIKTYRDGKIRFKTWLGRMFPNTDQDGELIKEPGAKRHTMVPAISVFLRSDDPPPGALLLSRDPIEDECPHEEGVYYYDMTKRSGLERRIAGKSTEPHIEKRQRVSDSPSGLGVEDDRRGKRDRERAAYLAMRRSRADG